MFRVNVVNLAYVYGQGNMYLKVGVNDMLLVTTLVKFARIKMHKWLRNAMKPTQTLKHFYEAHLIRVSLKRNHD